MVERDSRRLDQYQKTASSSATPHTGLHCLLHQESWGSSANAPNPKVLSGWNLQKSRVSNSWWNGLYFASSNAMQDRPICPKCNASEVVKNGKILGKQRFKCKKCCFQFTRHTPQGYAPEVKAQAVRLYSHGLSLRAVAKMLNVSRTSVLNWIKMAAKKNQKTS